MVQSDTVQSDLVQTQHSQTQYTDTVQSVMVQSDTVQSVVVQSDTVQSDTVQSEEKKDLSLEEVFCSFDSLLVNVDLRDVGVELQQPAALLQFSCSCLTEYQQELHRHSTFCH